jgi:Phosphotransferase enzyme family
MLMSQNAIDPVFPQISQLLDADFMRVRLQTALLDNSNPDAFPKATISQCLIGEKRHKPGKRFVVSYQLTLKKAGQNGVDERLVTAELIHKTQQKPAQQNPKCPAIQLADLDTTLWQFPHDRKLPHLADLHNVTFMMAYFARFFTRIDQPVGGRIIGLEIKVMHYLPMRSCMTRYTVKLAVDFATANLTTITLYGKAYVDDGGLICHNNMQQLAEQGGYCAKPLGYDTALNTLWQAHCEGVPLTWPCLSNPDSTGLLVRVAQSIAAFHASQLQSNKRYGLDDIKHQLEATWLIANNASPDLARKIYVINQLLQDYFGLIDWGTPSQGPVHLDLKLGNILVSDDKVVLIDMDEVCLGDPLADFGSFIANIYLNGLCANADIAAIDAVTAQLIAAYSAAMGYEGHVNKLNWYIAAALIHEVLRRSLRQQNPERLQHLASFIKISQGYCTAIKANAGI